MNTVLESLRTDLISQEIATIQSRTRFENGVRDRFNRDRASIDEISAEAGVSPEEIRRIIETPREYTGLMPSPEPAFV